MFHELENFNDQDCLVANEFGTWSYRQLATLCNELGSVTSTAQSGKKLILVLCENNRESICAYLSALRGQDTVMLLSANIDMLLLQQIVETYKPNFLYAPANHQILEKLSNVVHRFLNYVVVHSSEEQHVIDADLALMLSTSGSTGSPKFVRLSFANICANASSIAEYLEIESRDCPITVLPLAYSYGLSIINSHLHVGAKICLSEHSLMTREFWSNFKEQKVSSISGVPYTYEMLQRLRFERRDLSELRVMTQAGGKLSDELIQHFAELANNNGIRFFVMYGQTEATARISYVPHNMIIEKCGSIGIAIPGGVLENRSDNGEESELVYRGPNVMMGYAENLKDLAAGNQFAGVLPTGDLGRFDEDGYCYVTGRLKRIIKLFGNRVNLDDIDRYLDSIGIEGVAGGRDDMLRVMITNENAVENVKASLVSTFKFDHKAVDVFFGSEIPRNEAGKIQYAQVFSNEEIS